MGCLSVSLTKDSQRSHTFAYLRPDGSGESVVLDSRSFLLHDLSHLAVEGAFGLAAGVFGRLARGETYADLREPDAFGLGVESVVVRLQSAWRKKAGKDAFVRSVTEFAQAPFGPPLDWVHEAGLEQSWEALRGLDGRWRATHFGATMHVQFDLGD